MKYLLLIKNQSKDADPSEPITDDNEEEVLASAPIISALLATDDDFDEQVNFMNQADFSIEIDPGRKRGQINIPVAKTSKGFRALVTALQSDELLVPHANDQHLTLLIAGPEYAARQESYTLDMVNRAYQEIILGKGTT